MPFRTPPPILPETQIYREIYKVLEKLKSFLSLFLFLNVFFVFILYFRFCLLVLWPISDLLWFLFLVTLWSSPQYPPYIRCPCLPDSPDSQSLSLLPSLSCPWPPPSRWLSLSPPRFVSTVFTTQSVWKHSSLYTFLPLDMSLCDPDLGECYNLRSWPRLTFPN